MGNNNYQFRLQSLEVLDQYSNKLKLESDHLLSYPLTLKKIHEEFAESDQWNDVKHTEFFEEQMNNIILEVSTLKSKIDEAMNRLNQLKGLYSNAGIK